MQTGVDRSTCVALHEDNHRVAMTSNDKIAIELLPHERALLLSWTYPFEDVQSQLDSSLSNAGRTEVSTLNHTELVRKRDSVPHEVDPIPRTTWLASVG